MQGRRWLWPRSMRGQLLALVAVLLMPALLLSPSNHRAYTGGVVVLSLILASALYRRISSSLRELERHLQAFENGEPKHSPQLRSVSEFAAVATTLDRMVWDLKSARDAAEEANRRIELRVTERTAELQKANEELVQEAIAREGMQKALLEQSRLLEAFYTHTVTPLVFLDREFNFIRVNEAYARVCRKQACDFPGKNHFDLYPSEELVERFRSVIESKQPYYAFARPFVFPTDPDWGITYWDLSVAPLLDAEGRTEFLVFSLEDVTQRTLADRRSKIVDLIQALFTTKTTQKEYLEAVVEVIRSWSGCENVGIRVLDEEHRIPYMAYSGFSPEFMEQEANLSLNVDSCICLRVIAGASELSEAAVMTREGSFACNDTFAWLATLSPEARERYRGTCIRCGYASVAVIPVRYRNRAIGAIHLADPRVDAFAFNNVEFLESMAPLIAEAIHRFGVEESLRKTSLYARSLIEASLDPLVTISPSGEITDVNKATELATGVSRSELIGSNFLEYFTEPENANAGYQKVLTEGEVRDYPLTIRHVSGNTMDVLYNATMYRNEEGEAQGIFAAARDVTDRKRVEQALRYSEKLLAEAQRISHLGGWDWSVVEDDLSWSDEMFRIFGFEPQCFAVDYGRFLACVHPGDRARVDEAVKMAMNGAEHYDVEYRIVLPDGTIRAVHAQGEVMWNSAGEPIRMLGTVLDITERLRAQEEAKFRQQQLVQADKMVSLGILVSGVAHEINNPNHSIMANVAALAEVWESVQPILERFSADVGDFVLGGYEYSESREKFPEMFANALSNSKRIQVIVDELRDFARYSPLEKMAAVDINSVVESAVVLVSNMVRKCTEHFTVSQDRSLPLVTCNRQRIEQVVINLTQNACQSLRGRDKGISVSTFWSSEEKCVIIEVCDEGKGISEDDLRHLGDPFFTTKRASGGMGLGLWVSFNIAREHGGTLTFSSSPGKGTRARLALPAAEGERLRVTQEEAGEPVQ